MGNSAKRDTRAAATQEKRNQALELRKRGYTYRQIAQALDCAVAVAHGYVDQAIAAIPLEGAEDVRRLELERIDKMIAGVWATATQGDPKAIVAAVKLMDRRAKYLGLDAAQKIEMSAGAGPTIMIPPERKPNETPRVETAPAPAGLATQPGTPD